MFTGKLRIVVSTLLVAFAAATPPLPAQDADAIKAIRAELKELTKAIREREQVILKLQEEVTKLRQEVTATKAIAESLRERNLELLKQIEKLTKVKAGGDRRNPKDPNAANPPAAPVKGRVLKVDPNDGSLVEISIGTDSGVEKSQTLELYRLQPQPKYLGRVRILDANPTRSVGRVIIPAGVDKRPEIQVGDEVSSHLQPENPKKLEPQQANPPAVPVKGTINKLQVDSEGVQQISVSLGKNHGLQVGHTLELFCTMPQPKYLGLLRIISVEDETATGRLVLPPGVQPPHLMVGDNAWSHLTQ